MASLNRVLLIGNMTRDPQLSYLPSQTAVCEFGLAMGRKFKKQDGTWAEETCFVDCQMFGKRAETIQKYFKKGSPIFIAGRLKLDSWQTQDGSKRQKLRVLVENFEFLPNGQKPNQQGGDTASEPGDDYEPPQDSDEGVPF